MPFNEDHDLLIAAARSAAEARALSSPRRLPGLAVAGSLQALDRAFAGHAISQLTMAFNEFSNYCLEAGRAAMAASGQAAALVVRTAPTSKTSKAAPAFATLDWHGGDQFLLCLAAPADAAATFCRAFAAGRAEFARIHRWPGQVVLAVTAGEVVWTHGGADGGRALRAFGDPIARARRLAAHGERLAHADASDLVLCGPELEEILKMADEDVGMRVACVGA